MAASFSIELLSGLTLAGFFVFSMSSFLSIFQTAVNPLGCLLIANKVKQRVVTSSWKEENKFNLISKRVNICQTNFFSIILQLKLFPGN